ncbi:Sperm motility kinase W, partial [Grifola frondosa]
LSPSRPAHARSIRKSCEDSDDADCLSSSSSTSSFDEDVVNVRMTPYWCAYRGVIEGRGFRLDTFGDVKQYYERNWEGLGSDGRDVTQDPPVMLVRVVAGMTTNYVKMPDWYVPWSWSSLVPDNLFRGTQSSTGLKVVVKAVHLHSREYDVMSYLSKPQLRNHPMNHCIQTNELGELTLFTAILDRIEVPKDRIAFIVMEEWSSQLIADTPCNLKLFLASLRQCIEHTVFMHAHHIAHLDISLRNLLTDYKSHYACIDYELSRRYDGVSAPRIQCRRGTEVPPELERNEWSDPFKVDVWALGILMFRAMKLTGYDVPELYAIIKSMLHENYEKRPTARDVLLSFNAMTSRIGEARLQMKSPHQ